MSFIGQLKSGLTTIGKGVDTIMENSGFMSRTIGMNQSYGDLTALFAGLGREPISLLGKNYIYIYDHVRRNVLQGVSETNNVYNTYNGNDDYKCYNFTFYGDKPNIWFADPYTDNENLKGRWRPSKEFSITLNQTTEIFYAESYDNYVDNKKVSFPIANNGTAHGSVQSFSIGGIKSCDLIKKTNENFNHGRYQTLMARFHTNTDDSKRLDDPTQTAVNTVYGMSHGRNLTKKTPTIENGYDNPYCRVWTYHHNYHTIKDAIRPFSDETGTGLFGFNGEASFRTNNISDKVESGTDRLLKRGVLDYHNGFVRIAPTAKLSDYFGNLNDFEGKPEKYSIKRCMFSIENLAWKNTGNGGPEKQFNHYGLSPEQRGPFGGRIMWFPPYGLTFSEAVDINWNESQFIGRGEGVYTYTNTNRTGTLSFEMLIDHPSLIDYLDDTMTKGVGVEEGGAVVYSGNETRSGEDEAELKLLRFFAGCDILNVKPQKEKDPSEPQENKKPEPPNDNSGNSEVTDKESEKIFIAVYFPNNYSGVNDDADYAVDYLMCGAGTGKYLDDVKYVVDGEGKVVSGNGPQDIDIDRTVKTDTNNGRQVLGYEVSEYGISIVDEQINTGVTSAVKASVKDFYEAKYDFKAKKDEKPEPKTKYVLKEAITKGNGEEVTITIGKEGSKKTYIPAKMTHFELGYDTPDKAKNYNVNGSKWKEKKWYYRVDDKQPVVNYTLEGFNFDYKVHEVLTAEGGISYVDNTSFKLNSKDGFKGNLRPGGGGTEQLLIVHEQLNEEYQNNKNIPWYSFADLYCAAHGKDNTAVGEYANETYINHINEVLKGGNGCEVEHITVFGNASTHGYNEANRVLALNRATTIADWFKKYFEPLSDKVEPKGPKDPKDPENGESGGRVQSPGSGINKGTGNDFDYKMWRSALIMIEYKQQSNKPHVTSVNAKDQIVDVEEKDSATGELTHKQRVDQLVVQWSEGYYDSDEYRERYSKSYAFALENSYNNFISEHNIERNEYYLNKIKQEKDNFNKYIEKEFRKKAEEEVTLQEKAEKEAKEKAEQDRLNRIPNVKRYDNEGEFFQRLSEESPFLHHKIKDKIKYFDPAFHSISPEGFNARLTFLHQCTRQGPTIENASELGTTAAYNLAFGRPPICVLRVGDFYYTKIVITSLNIEYDGNPQWDLNPEGIGVMPMYAKVTIQFRFIGGSGLEGPISRLQNAVSFNYYANTTVYDNRSEIQLYDEKGDTTAFVGYMPK